MLFAARGLGGFPWGVSPFSRQGALRAPDYFEKLQVFPSKGGKLMSDFPVNPPHHPPMRPFSSEPWAHEGVGAPQALARRGWVVRSDPLIPPQTPKTLASGYYIVAQAF